MKKLYSLILLLSVMLSAKALTIPAGTFYFDNSKTQYEQVKFVYGSDTSAETYVLSMSLDEGSRWKITIPTTVTDMYRYTFAATALTDGKIEKTFSTVKEEISKTYNEMRTATTDAAILVGGIYVPATGDNWAQGSWQMLGDATIGCSGTLPVMYINTENGAEIVSKEDYINATYYLDAMGVEGVTSLGDETNQLPLEIRGRGNYTWTGFDKKPYRIKLGSKTAILGMSKSKHFALLAHADDNLGFLRNTVGFELSRRLGLKFTPAQAPVEVVLNGDYIGLYFLTETVRVDTNRVNIVEQADEATSASEITGGWLVEIDNYEEDLQVRITEGNGEVIRFTYKTPEVLSSAQEAYLTNQMNTIDDAIYNTNKNSTDWESFVDMDSLARFYIVQEIMDNAESFHGSCYLHKEIGADTKWIFGPVWDFGNAYHRSWQEFIYQNPPFGQTWIGEIAKYPRFQTKVVEIWKKFKGNDYESLDAFIDDFIAKIAVAAQYDALRWPSYGNYDAESRKAEFKTMLENRIAWLVTQWGEGESGVPSVKGSADVNIVGGSEIVVSAPTALLSVEVYDISGRLVVMNNDTASQECTIVADNGIYVVKATTLEGVSVAKVVVK